MADFYFSQQAGALQRFVLLHFPCGFTRILQAVSLAALEVQTKFCLYMIYFKITMDSYMIITRDNYILHNIAII